VTAITDVGKYLVADFDGATESYSTFFESGPHPGGTKGFRQRRNARTDGGKPGKADRSPRHWRKIIDAPPYELASVVDDHNHRALVISIGDAGFSAERERAMRRGQCARVQLPTARGPGTATD
jgi:hypothetical protein